MQYTCCGERGGNPGLLDETPWTVSTVVTAAAPQSNFEFALSMSV